MKYQVKISKSAEKELCKLDKYAQKQIISFLENNVAADKPRNDCKPLKYNWAGHWRYDIGKYRIICEIKDDICAVLVITIGHRRDVYR